MALGWLCSRYEVALYVVEGKGVGGSQILLAITGKTARKFSAQPVILIFLCFFTDSLRSIVGFCRQLTAHEEPKTLHLAQELLHRDQRMSNLVYQSVVVARIKRDAFTGAMIRVPGTQSSERAPALQGR